MIVFLEDEKMQSILCSLIAHYFFGSLLLSSFKQSNFSFTSPAFQLSLFNCFKNLDVGMILLQTTIFQGLAATIFSRLIQHIHIQRFILEAILLASQKAIIGFAHGINSIMNLKVLLHLII